MEIAVESPHFNFLALLGKLVYFVGHAAQFDNIGATGISAAQPCRKTFEYFISAAHWFDSDPCRIACALWCRKS